MRQMLTEQHRAFCTQDLRTVRDLENFLHVLLGFSRSAALEISSRFVGKAERRLEAANVRTRAHLELALRRAGYSQTEAADISSRFDSIAHAPPAQSGGHGSHQAGR